MEYVTIEGAIRLKLINAGYDIKILVALATGGHEIYMYHCHRKQYETDDDFLGRIMRHIDLMNKDRMSTSSTLYYLSLREAKESMGML